MKSIACCAASAQVAGAIGVLVACAATQRSQGDCLGDLTDRIASECADAAPEADAEVRHLALAIEPTSLAAVWGDFLQNRDTCAQFTGSGLAVCNRAARDTFCRTLRDLFPQVESRCPLPEFEPGAEPRWDRIDSRVLSLVDPPAHGIHHSLLFAFGWNEGSVELIFLGGGKASDRPVAVRVDQGQSSLIDTNDVGAFWIHFDANGHAIRIEGVMDLFRSTHPLCDWDRNLRFDSSDVLGFFGSSARGAPRADINGDGVIDGADVAAFVDACPD